MKLFNNYFNVKTSETIPEEEKEETYKEKEKRIEYRKKLAEYLKLKKTQLEKDLKNKEESIELFENLTNLLYLEKKIEIYLDEQQNEHLKREIIQLKYVINCIDKLDEHIEDDYFTYLINQILR
jgi:hypothetical protein